MRFLIDNNLPTRFARGLTEAGHDAVHLRDVLPQDSADGVVFAFAGRDRRVIVAQDTDFGAILAQQQTSEPLVVLFRCRSKSVEALLPLLLANLPHVKDDLDAGAVVVIEDTRVRVRLLPFGR